MLGLIGLCAASTAGACLYFFLSYVPRQRAAIINGWEQELALRASLRKMTIDRWAAGGKADAETLAGFPSALALVAHGRGTTPAERDEVNTTHLREVAESFTRIRGYSHFALLDANLGIVIETGLAAPLVPAVRHAAAEVLAWGKSAIDFHRHADGTVTIAFLARVAAGSAPLTSGGVVLLETDPNHWLYPYLAMRPMAALSAETLIVQADGDDIVFLSPLRHRPAPPLTFRRPANLAHFAASAALRGSESFGAYVDYRDEPVFAATIRLDLAPWGIVVKVDQREALADYRQEIRHTGAAAAGAILAFWALVFLLVLAWRRRAEQRLEVEHSLLRAIINRPDDVIVFSLDPSYCYTAFNEKHRLEMKKVWNADIRVGMRILDCMQVPALRDLAKVSIDRALRGEAFWEEQHQPDPDIYYEFSWNPILLGMKIIGVAVFIRDITERKRAEADVRRVGLYNRRLIEASLDPLVTIGPEGKITDVNEATTKVTGCPREKLMGSDFSSYFTQPEQAREGYQRVFAEGHVTDYPLEVKHTDGHTTPVLYNAAVYQDEAGHVVGVFAAARDITERKRAETAIREREDRFRSTLESMLEGCQIIGHDWRYLYLNGAAEAHNRRPIGELLGNRYMDVWPGIEATEVFVRIGRCLHERVADHMENEFTFPDGKRGWFDLRFAPVPEGVCILSVDITERRRAENELAALNRELEQRVVERTAELSVANQELESFAYAVSHDLRAPLRGIDGWSQAVLEDYGPRLDERGRGYLETVRRESQRMGELIDELLELSRVTRAPLERKTVDLTALAQELGAGLRASQPERVVDFVVAPGMVAVGDAVLMRAVLQNLLDNAWKFTGRRPRASIEVGSTLEGGQTVYHVRDDGVGFDMRFAGKLFAPFRRLHSLEEFPGTGIGLATVQRIIHRHGGKVWATAELDRGATFYFSLTA